MKGDFTRDTFDPANHFSRVLMQQGRVQLDADWNEQTAILLHYLHTLAKDLLGPYAGPIGDDLGFTITPTGNGSGDWNIGPGRYYVGGILVENERRLLYTEQPGYRHFAETIQIGNLNQAPLLFYLDVWERHITFVQDDAIREVAIGGADTCSRAQVMWQVKAVVPPHSLGEPANPFDSTFDDLLKGYLPVERKLPRVSARAKMVKSTTDVCVVSPESRYRGVENQLYRVEVHTVPPEGTDTESKGTFKWSRENGSVVFPIRSVTVDTGSSTVRVVVEHLGRDQRLSLKSGDWVELTDDDIAMSEGAGVMGRVTEVEAEALTVTLELPQVVTADWLPATEVPNKHPLLRRWDQTGDLMASEGALPIVGSDAPEDGWIDLEDGVQVRFFEDGAYKVGDYWLIPARVATGDVEWPSDVDDKGNSVPSAREPNGPRHYCAPLYYVQKDHTGVDCRYQIELSRKAIWKQ